MKRNKKIDTILQCFFDEKEIEYDKDSGIYNTPFCLIIKEGDEWLVFFDFETSNIFSAELVKEFLINEIPISITENYWHLFNKNDVCVETIFSAEVAETIKQYDLTMDQALELLTNKYSNLYDMEIKKQKLH